MARSSSETSPAQTQWRQRPRGPGASARTLHQLHRAAAARMRCLRTRCAPALLLALALAAPASAQQLQPQCTAAQVEEAAFAVAAACGINLHGKIPSASPEALPLPAECGADCPGRPGRLSALGVSHSASVLHGVSVRALQQGQASFAGASHLCRGKQALQRPASFATEESKLCRVKPALQRPASFAESSSGEIRNGGKQALQGQASFAGASGRARGA